MAAPGVLFESFPHTLLANSHVLVSMPFLLGTYVGEQFCWSLDNSIAMGEQSLEMPGADSLICKIQTDPDQDPMGFFANASSEVVSVEPGRSWQDPRGCNL